MSDSSEEEDLSRFREAVDTSFYNLINDAKNKTLNGNVTKVAVKPKSERFLDEASHYNDVKVPEKLQKQIGEKVSAVIHKNIEFVNVVEPEKKKHKIKGGVKLFKDSDGFMKCEGVEDTYTAGHNEKSKKLKRKRRQIDPGDEDVHENDKINAAAITGEYVLSKEETNCWKSRRKEKIFKYKARGKTLISLDEN